MKTRSDTKIKTLPNQTTPPRNLKVKGNSNSKKSVKVASADKMIKSDQISR